MVANSEFILEKLRSVLSEDVFDYATTTYIYSETKSLTYNYIGMSEFRDALTHVKRAVNADSEQKVTSEMESAFEHIRRAAVESMQFYVETKFFDLRNRLKNPFLYLFISTYKLDWKNIRRTEEEVKELLACARDSKPKTEWREAIGFFYKAETEIEKLDEIIPSKEQISQKSTFFLMILMIVLLLLMIAMRIL
jgi:hypothetical protein